MTPTEKKAGELFGGFDREADTYFSDAGCRQPLYAFHFGSLPELRSLLEERLGDLLDRKEILEAAKAAFRKKPKTGYEYTALTDREPADFIYEM